MTTRPASGSTNVDLAPAAHVEFSERMNRPSVERAVIVSPRPDGDLTFRWRGRRLEIGWPEPFRPERTYRVSIGAGSSDESGNRMPATHDLVFSTGSSLDRGEIVGSIRNTDGGAGTVFAWAFDLDGPEDVDLSRREPDYVTEVGRDATFRFPALGAGRYRVFAFRDLDRDRAYTPGVEPLAVPPADVALSPDTRIVLGPLHLAPRDTIPPALVSARTTDRLHCELRFSEWVRPGLVLDAPDLDVLAAHTDPRDSTSVVALTAPQTGGREYAMRVTGVRDAAGNYARDTLIVLRGDDRQDATSPDIVRIAPPSGAEYVVPTAPVEILFGEAMDTAAVSDALAPVFGRPTWSSANRVQLAPEAPRLPGPWARRVPAGAIRDAAGNAIRDSLVVQFVVAGDGDYGEITGTAAPDTAYRVVAVRDIPGGSAVATVRLAPGDTTFAIPGIVPGRYVVSGFRDPDGSEDWNPGAALPFVPSEPLSERVDTVDVRARWTAVVADTLRFRPVRVAATPPGETP